jgi:predicted DNA-binding transcriptional regulator YafY
LEIVYSSIRKGYELKESDAHEVERLLNLLHLSETAGLPVQNYKKLLELSEYILFENRISSSGIQFLRDILFAIQQKFLLNFSHFNYHTEKTTSYHIKPILLKQYLQRWYVIGEIENGEYRTFGLDRLSDLSIEKKNFPKQNHSTIKKKFEQIIGLNYSDSEPMKVRLELSSLQAKYLKTAPLHGSQYIELETKDTVVFVLHVITNYELIQRILMMADQVQVLEPHSLKKEVHQLLKSTIALYK